MTDQSESEQAAEQLEKRRKALKDDARELHGAFHVPSATQLTGIAERCRELEIEADSYGEGEDLQAFEARVAAMLGYPAARFLPSGTMAQPIAMRIWAERAGINLIGMHPTCHLELHEEDGYRRLHGLQSVMVGPTERPMLPEDLDAAVEPMSALIIELPTRENGGQLAAWDDLVTLSENARERGISVHLDGARLWEAAAGYDRSLAEICELFDSTYVSFYKGIGALPGSMLAGPEDFVDEVKLWQRRQGGNLYSLLPNWVSADMHLDSQIAKMATFRDRAIEIAVALEAIEGVTINPATPQVNMFHAYFEGDGEALLVARDTVAEEHKIWLFSSLRETTLPNMGKIEVVVGDATMALEVAEIRAAFAALVA